MCDSSQDFVIDVKNVEGHMVIFDFSNSVEFVSVNLLIKVRFQEFENQVGKKIHLQLSILHSYLLTFRFQTSDF